MRDQNDAGSSADAAVWFKSCLLAVNYSQHQT